MELAYITLILFGLFSSFRVVSYVPQIYRIATDCNRASAISYTTWILWAGANMSTALYAAVNLGDRYLTYVSAIYAFCCMIVVILTYAKRSSLDIWIVEKLGEARARRMELMAQLHRTACAGASLDSRCGYMQRFVELDIARACRRILLCDAWIAILVLGVKTFPCEPSARRIERRPAS